MAASPNPPNDPFSCEVTIPVAFVLAQPTPANDGGPMTSEDVQPLIPVQFG